MHYEGIIHPQSPCLFLSVVLITVILIADKMHKFHLFSALPSLSPQPNFHLPSHRHTHTHNGQTHTNVTWRGVLAQMSYKIRNDERLGAQTKEKFPWWYGSFLGSV